MAVGYRPTGFGCLLPHWRGCPGTQEVIVLQRAIPHEEMVRVLALPPHGGTAMKTFLQRFGSLVSGVLQGFDRLVFKGRLRQLYFPEGMHNLLALNHVLRSDFKT